MKISAAVVREKSGPMRIEALEIDEPRAGEVLVRVTACGVCHTDMAMRDQELPVPQPVVLGHEGAGYVARVGPGVAKVAPGDAVIMSFASCGHCPACAEHEPSYCAEFFPRNFFATRADGTTGLSRGGEKIHSHVFGQSAFATYALTGESNVVRVPPEAPLALLAPLGCGVQTGAGAIMNALRVRPGASVAVFGAGAVGLSAVMAARLIGASPIIAIDPNPARRALAQELGADIAIDPRAQDPVATIQAHTGGGARYALDATGRADVVGQAVACLGVRGVCAIAGAVKFGDALPIDGGHLMSGGRVVRGVVEGDANPDTFIPALIQLHAEGKLPLEKLVRFYDFADINQAIADSESGRTVKPVLLMPAA